MPKNSPALTSILTLFTVGRFSNIRGYASRAFLEAFKASANINLQVEFEHGSMNGAPTEANSADPDTSNEFAYDFTPESHRTRLPAIGS